MYDKVLPRQATPVPVVTGAFVGGGPGAGIGAGVDSGSDDEPLRFGLSARR